MYAWEKIDTEDSARLSFLIWFYAFTYCTHHCTEHFALRHKLKSCTVPFLYRSDLVTFWRMLYRPDMCNCTMPYVHRTVPANAVRYPAYTAEVVALTQVRPPWLTLVKHFCFRLMGINRWSKYRPISELQLAEAIWLVVDSSTLWTFRTNLDTNKKKDVAESSVLSVVYMWHVLYVL